MREPYTQLYLHLVWATWDRLPLLPAELRPAVYGCIQAECRQLDADVVAIRGTEDHVHLLVRISTTISVAQLVKQVKGSSSHLVNRRLTSEGTFKWQGGYGAFTVSKRNVPLVREYILRQEDHHRDHETIAAYEPPHAGR